MKKSFLAFVFALCALSYSSSPALAASSKAKLLTDTSSSANTVPFINAGPAEDSTAATALGIQVGGTERMRVTATGSVGIGTASPNESFEAASTSARAIISDGAGVNRRGLLLIGPVSGNDVGRIEAYGYGTSGGGKPLTINNVGGGSVGIGISSPLAMLHVYNPTTLTTSIGSSALGAFGQLTSNSSNLYLHQRRFAAGTTWETSNMRVQRVVDTTSMGFIDFGINGITGDQGLGFGSGSTTSMVLTSGGNVGIGTTNPSGKLTVVSSTGDAIQGFQDGSGISAIFGRGSASAFAGYFYNTGGGTCSFGYSNTSWSCASDLRLKKNITKIDGALDKISKIDGVFYQWRRQTNQKMELGVIAQNVQEVFPEAVNRSRDGYLGVQYDALVPPLIEAVKELKAENDTLRAEIKAKDAAFAARLDALETRGR